MNRLIVLFVFLVLLVVTGTALYVISRPKPAPVQTMPAATLPAPTVVPRRAPVASAAPVPPSSPRRRAASSPRAASPARRAEPSPPPEDVVTLRVDSDVPGAQVFVDRQFVGAAPVSTSDVKPGTHQINVSAPGYDAYAEAIELAPGTREVIVRQGSSPRRQG